MIMIRAGTWDRPALIPLSQVQRIQPFKNKNDVIMAELVTEDSQWRTRHLFEEVGNLPVQLIPAEPGINLLHLFTDGDEPDQWCVSPTAVIAWALCLDGEVRPVTPAGVNDAVSDPDIGFYVSMPDGRVESACQYNDRSNFESADELLDYVLEQQGKRRPEVNTLIGDDAA